MYAPYEQTMEEDHFANINYSKNIDCIIPTSELMVNFRVNGLRAKKPCFVYAEKMDFKGLIQLRLTEKCDQRRMYITTVDSNTFHELKQDQSLHVTFAGFIDNLVRILQDCQAGKLEINLLQTTTHSQRNSSQDFINTSSGADGYQLQFVEMRAFKNLVHLCLPSRLAPLNVVLFYMHSILEALQKKAIKQEHSTQQLQHELHAELRRIEQLNADNEKLRENLMENTCTLNKRHREEIEKFEENLRKAMEQRQTEDERSRKTIAALQIQLEKQATEKANIQAEKLQEHKRCENLNEELSSSKGRVASLKDQIDKLHAELTALKNSERKNEMHLNDARRHIAELQEKLHQNDKSKADIVAELEAEKKILQTKRQALEMATEEISKANQIILKQSQELAKLKKIIELRTEVALQQEKAINEKEKQLTLRDQEIQHMQNTIESLRQEIPQQLESMRQFASSLETKYTEQIKALKDKLKLEDKENSPLAIGGSAFLRARHK